MFGTVLKYDRVKSFGFIVADSPTQPYQTDPHDQPDFFVCAPFIAGKQRWLMANWRVEFTPVETEKGFEAHDVKILQRVIARQVSGNGGAK